MSWEADLQRHIDRWRLFLTSTQPTNKELAEQTLNDYYRIVKGNEPVAVLWCDSPFQMQVIPPLVAGIVSSDKWSELVATMKSEAQEGGPEWEARWQSEWGKLEEQSVNVLIDKVINQTCYAQVDDLVKSRAVACLRRCMRELLVNHKLKANSISSWNFKNPMGYVGSLQDPDIRVSILSLLVQVELCLELNSTTRTILRTAMPGLADLLPPRKQNAEKIKAAYSIREKFADVFLVAGMMSNWMSGLFPPPGHIFGPPPDWQVDGGTPDLITLLRSAVDEVEDALRAAPDELMRLMWNSDLSNRSTHWLPFATLPFILACRFIDRNFFGELQEKIDCLAFLSHAAAGYLFCRDVCFACAKPVSLQTNAAGRLHNPNGPAQTWRDGLKLYAWRGVMVAPELIEDKQSITWQRINNERNAELRRVMMDIYGEARYLLDSGAVVVEETELGILYRLDIPNDEPLVMVRVRNSTPEPDGTYKVYFLRVPPEMERVKQAVAWTFGLTEDQYQPNVES